MSDERPGTGATAGNTPMPVAGPRRRPQQGSPTPTASTKEGGAGDEGDVRLTVFDALGGQAFFDRLVGRFYEHVAGDDVLLRLYPEQDDLGPARERLALFLAQYWGGPATYSERRGHPRLRMRHAPFRIGQEERDHWLAAMLEALDHTLPTSPLPEDLRDEVAARMRDYFTLAADHLVNAGS